MRSGKRSMVLGAAALAAVGLGYVTGSSAASKNFTLAMEDSARDRWDKSFNELVAEPFSKVGCVPDKKLAIGLGDGCVDTGEQLICCKTWSVNLRCHPDKTFKQSDIEGFSCETKPVDDEDD